MLYCERDERKRHMCVLTSLWSQLVSEAVRLSAARSLETQSAGALISVTPHRTLSLTSDVSVLGLRRSGLLIIGCFFVFFGRGEEN